METSDLNSVVLKPIHSHLFWKKEAVSHNLNLAFEYDKIKNIPQKYNSHTYAQIKVKATIIK